MHPLAKLDHQFIWHPFTQMQDWLKHEPILITEGTGAVLRDAHGKEYLDANSSIWTNLHGHCHPGINAALRRQMVKIAHSSALGLANEPASRLAEQLITAANAGASGFAARSRQGRSQRLAKVFFSDDGSTALEVALKLAYEYARRSGRSQKPKFLSLQGAYHGDTVGAVSLGHIDLFHKAYSGLLFKTRPVPAPYCYRCRFNRANPAREDAREYRKCHWECLDAVERGVARERKSGNPIAAMVVEPLIQGAAGMIPQPMGWLKRVEAILRADGAQLIADEVLTGFGRAVSMNHTGKDGIVPHREGSGPRENPPVGAARRIPPLFACQTEDVKPDFLALAKGMTGGYLPMAATLTTGAVFDAFLGEYGAFKTFFHGHSFTANQLGAAAALASLELVQSPATIARRIRLEAGLRTELAQVWEMPNVGDIRQVGLIAGIELVKNWKTRERFDPKLRIGGRVCEAMARKGVLTRPVGDVLVLMPPYCTSPAQLSRMVAVLTESTRAVLG